MDSFLATQELPESITTTGLLERVPLFVKEAQTLAIPGAEKKTAVIQAMHSFVKMLKDNGKVGDDLAKELDAFIDETISKTVDLLIDVAKGRITLTAPKTVEEVQQHVNCFLQLVKAVLAIVKKSKAPKPAEAPMAAEAPVAAEAAEAPKADEPAEATEA